jgi:glycerophosphoryl diester phosphodiesterase
VAAFKLGWEQQADADELDLHLSKDGRIVVIHDPTTKRTAGVDRKVVEQTFAELRMLDAGSWRGPQWAGEKIPTLPEALATMPDGKRFLIEIKCGPEILPELERAVKASGRTPKELVIIGFGYETMRQAKERFPELQTYWLVSPEKGSDGLRPPVAELIAKAKAARLDGLNLNFAFAMDSAFVSAVKDAGLKLYTWTVDDPAVAKKLAELGVDGITTNRPEWLRAQLQAVPNEATSPLPSSPRAR